LCTNNPILAKQRLISGGQSTTSSNIDSLLHLSSPPLVSASRWMQITYRRIIWNRCAASQVCGYVIKM
jgi:hypothetical protein